MRHQGWFRFSFGFRARACSASGPGDTDYRLSLLPLGGYVKMAGDNPAEEVAPEDKNRAFLSASAWKRALIAFAGPAMNLVLPVVVFFCLAVAAPHEGIAPGVGMVMPDSPAAGAGIQAGRSNRRPSTERRCRPSTICATSSPRRAAPCALAAERDGSPLTLTMTPDILEETDDLETTHRRVIGIRPLPPPRRLASSTPPPPRRSRG